MKVTPPEGLQETAARELLAMLEVMYLVATADGYFSNEERLEFVKTMESLSEGKVEAPELTRLVDSWIQRGPESDIDERLRTLSGALPDEISRRIAYGLALQIADADGQYLESEARILDKMARAFGLAPEASEDIAHSVRMSRRPRPA